MTAKIKFKGVSITLAQRTSPVGAIYYDGQVTYSAHSDSVQFDYVYEFKDRDSIDLEIENGVLQLKTVLTGVVKTADEFRLAP